MTAVKSKVASGTKTMTKFSPQLFFKKNTCYPRCKLRKEWKIAAVQFIRLTFIDLNGDCNACIQNKVDFLYMFKFKLVALYPLCHLKLKVMINVEPMKILMLTANQQAFFILEHRGMTGLQSWPAPDSRALLFAACLNSFQKIWWWDETTWLLSAKSRKLTLRCRFQWALSLVSA